MEPLIRILHLEDTDDDAELIQQTLHGEGVAFKANTVKNRADFETALKQGNFDLILSDYNLLSFDGLAALNMARERSPSTPFIFVSGSIGEEMAIEISKRGATDYVLKDRLSRLGIVVRRARREAQERAEREKAESALRASQEQMALVLRSVSVALYRSAAGSVHRTLWISDNVERLSGFPPKAFTDVPDLRNARIHPDDQAYVVAKQADLPNQGETSIEYRWKCADGLYRWFQDRITVVRNDDGTLKDLLGSWEDITERKIATEEKAELEKQLRQAQKMEAVGQLAGGVAHDFNNLLCVINGRAELILGRLDPDDPLRKPIDLICKTGARAANLTRKLLTFSRSQMLELKILDLNAVVKDMEMMLLRLIREDTTLTKSFDPALRRVKADAGQIEQVLMNLVVNARDAMPAGGIMNVTTANVELDETFCRKHAGLKPGSYVMLAVSDTGSGMDEYVKAHLFEPFFTTKEQGKGTGLGLATIYGIVKQSAGGIEVESELGMGSTFKVYLPVTEQVDRTPPGKVATAPTSGKETILLVEDEEQVRDFICDVLKFFGYAVLPASDGIEALALFQEQHQSVQLVMTDVIMPKMSGTELVAHMRRIQPQVNVLFMSGYSDKMIDESDLDSYTGFIQKPFTPTEISRKIREVLDRIQKPGA